MKKQITFISIILLSLIIPAATYAQVTSYGGGRVSDRQMRLLLTRIASETATFRNEALSAANRNVLNANREDRLDNMLDELSSATTTLNSQYDSRRDATVE